MEISSLKDELNKWYDDNCKNGNLAWSYLAKKSGVTASNIRKIAKGEVGQPRFDTARKLCESIFPESADAVATYLKEIYPKEAATWFIGNPHRRELPKGTFDVTRDLLAFRLFYLALTDAARVADLEAEYGKEKVTQKLKALSSAELVEVDSNGILVRKEGTKYAKNSCPHAIANSFRNILSIVEEKISDDEAGVAEIDRESNRLDYLYLSLNDKGSSALNSEIREFKEKMYRLLTSPEYEGDIPRFVNIAIGRFDNK